MDKDHDPSQVVQDLEKAIASLETQRGTLGDSAVDSAIQSLREKLAQLAASEYPMQQRKMATILFMDIAGHTKMTRHLDPEDNMALIDSALVRLTKPILQHGGHIARYQGDGFKAVFGLPTARENDPEHAVQAGLEIHAVAKEIAAEFEAQHGLTGFLVRVGIDTGLVVSGGTTEGEDTIKGTPIVMAARLESAAPAGGILISHDTYRQMRGLFTVQEREPLLAKGYEKPVRVYQVLRAKPRPFYMAKREFEGFETRTIGREAELLILQNAFQDIVESHEARLVTVVGDAGVGKSRLLYEFENWVVLLPDETVFYFKGRASPEDINYSAGLWHDLFSYRFQIKDTDSISEVHSKFTAGMADLVAPKIIPVIGQLCGFDFSHIASAKSAMKDPDFDQIGVSYLAAYFRALSETNPVLLLLEDIHWADDRSLDLLDHLMARLHGCRILVICLARPGLFERRPDWGSGQAFSARLDLKPLSLRQSRQLVDEVLQRVQGLPAEMRELLSRESEGNPFYLEELVKMLLDQEVIQRGEDAGAPWQVVLEKLQSIKLPDTLAGVLQARLDGLPDAEKDVLRRASVIGRLFWDRAVDYLEEDKVNQGSAQTLEQVWPSLRTRELVFHREHSAFQNAQEYIFKHALLREAVYESVLRRVRKEYHRRAALWLILVSADRTGEFASLIADHWALAEDPIQEAEWQFRAAQWAFSRYAHPETLKRLERALAFYPESEHEKRFEILKFREQVHAFQGNRELQGEDLELLEQLLDTIDDPEQHAYTALRLSEYKYFARDCPTAILYAQQAYQIAKNTGNHANQAEAYFRWGLALRDQNEIHLCREKLNLALDLARMSGFLEIVMEASLPLSWETPDFDQKVNYLENALHIARQIGDRRNEAKLLSELGYTFSLQGKGPLDRKPYYLAALKILREIGARADEAYLLMDIGYLAEELGEKPGRQEYHQQALQIFQEIGSHHSAIWAIHKMGEAESFYGDLEKARQYFQQAQTLAFELGDGLQEALALMQIGISFTFGHHYKRSLEHLQMNLPDFIQQGNRFGESAVYLMTGLILASLGKYQESVIHAEKALAISQTAGIENIEGLVQSSLCKAALGLKDYPRAIQHAEDALQVEDDLVNVFVFNRLGYAYLGMGKLEEASTAFSQGVQHCRQQKFYSRAVENQAGLAKVFLEQNEINKALVQVEEILDYLQNGNLDRTDEPVRIYMNCYEVLQAARDPRSTQILADAYAQMQKIATQLDENHRESFLNIPINTAVLSLWNFQE